LAARIKVLGDEHPHVARTLTALAAVRIQRDDLDRAESELVRAEAILTRQLGDTQADLAAARHLRGLIAWRTDDVAAARALCESAVDMAEVTGVRPGLQSEYRLLLARVLWDAGEADLAIRALDASAAL